MDKELKNAINEKELESSYESYNDIKALGHIYSAAMRQIATKIEILNDEFAVRYERNPIHHVETRLKTTDSIIKKLKAKGCEVSAVSAKKNINDIAGIRVVCSYIDDVYAVSEMLLRQSDISLVKIEDYIREPNFNGYRSLHLDIEVPVYLSSRTEYVSAEVQIRTVAMDFWASLEHDLRYKSTKKIPEHICKSMIESAEEIASIDAKMQAIYKEIQKL